MSVPFLVVTPCDVDGAADVSGVPSAFIFRVEVCDMGGYLCIGFFFSKSHSVSLKRAVFRTFPVDCH
jgi:hypothetical protein